MSAVEGIARLQAYFASASTRQGILARRLLGKPSADDSQLAKELVRRLIGEIRADGSLGGAFVSTAWAIVELHDLGGDLAAATRLSEWLLARQDAPGRFGEGCTPPRHAGRTCEHFMSGFFAVAPATERVSPLTLPTGKVIRSEGTARFAASCLALRAAILAGQGSQAGVQAHREPGRGSDGTTADRSLSDGVCGGVAFDPGTHETGRECHRRLPRPSPQAAERGRHLVRPRFVHDSGSADGGGEREGAPGGAEGDPVSPRQPAT